MKKLAKLSLVLVLILSIAFALVGCTEADRVSSNISKEADSFNVVRRISVLNMRSDKPIFELVGAFSLGNNGSNELTVTVEIEEGVYKKHFIYLNQWTMYVVEDLSGANVSRFKYEINYLPEMIIPYTITSND